LWNIEYIKRGIDIYKVIEKDKYTTEQGTDEIGESSVVVKFKINLTPKKKMVLIFHSAEYFNNFNERFVSFGKLNSLDKEIEMYINQEIKKINDYVENKLEDH
jgi:hypothetical protein